MNILVTGANGFLGSYVVNEALEKGWTVFAAVRPSSDRKYLRDSRIRFINLHYTETTTLTGQFCQLKADGTVFDYVVHCAGIINACDKNNFFRVNYEYSKNLVEALIAANAVPQKFVYISSLSASGPGDFHSPKPIMLSDMPTPNTFYGKSKRKTEEFLESLVDFPYMSLRLTGIYGPRDRGFYKYARFVRNGFIPILGFSPQYLTFIHAHDAARIIVAALESPLIQRTYFIADGDVYTLKEYAAIVRKCLKKRIVITFTFPLWLVKSLAYVLDATYGWFGKSCNILNKDKYNIISARNWICETEPLFRDLHIRPQHQLPEAMQETINWYKLEKWL